MANFSLLAKFGVDTSTLQNGLKDAEKHVSGFRRSIAKTGAVLRSFGPIVGGIGFAAMTKHVIESGKELSNLSQIAGVGAEEFQRMSHASKTVGISQEKLADILKDVNDKVGDFIQTGGGPMADFFEKIAPKVGVTAEQFKKLSSRDALQLYVDSLEKANLSQSDMTFYMEAIASDATALIPLLKENGKLFQDIGGSLKSPMTDAEAKKMKEAADLLDELGQKATILGAKALTGVADVLSFDVSRRDFAKAQLKQEGAFEGLGFFTGRKERKQLIDDRVSLNAELAAKEAEADERRKAEEAAELAAIQTLENGYTEKTPEEKRKEDLEALNERIKSAHLEQLQAQASGDKAASSALEYRVKLMRRAVEIMRQFEIDMAEAAKLAAADLDKKKPKKNDNVSENDDEKEAIREQLGKKLADIERDRIRAQASGDKAAEQSLSRRVQLAGEILRLMDKGFDRAEATMLASNMSNLDQPEDKRGDFVSSLTGEDLKSAANEAAEKGTRFQRMADGTFQKYVNGSRKGNFTEAQLQAGLEKRIEKDPTDKTLKDIKNILQGKFVNE